jgi:hypothetical protein
MSFLRLSLSSWLADFDATVWDREFERYVVEGRLDALADEALRDARWGHGTGS